LTIQTFFWVRGASGAFYGLWIARGRAGTGTSNKLQKLQTCVISSACDRDLSLELLRLR
jgi:hypothetical protein